MHDGLRYPERRLRRREQRHERGPLLRGQLRHHHDHLAGQLFLEGQREPAACGEGYYG